MGNKKEIDLSDKVKETYELIIQLTNEEELKELYEQLTKEGYKCRVLVL